MDYKYIEQLLERYFNAETTLKEEDILRSFFSQDDIPAEMQQWRALFTAEEDATLGDDFDARILEMTVNRQSSTDNGLTMDNGQRTVKAREVSIAQRLKPFFKAAAVIAIIITIGGALQAPWDSSWNTPADYASYQYKPDSVDAASPIQAENISEKSADSVQVLLPNKATPATN